MTEQPFDLVKEIKALSPAKLDFRRFNIPGWPVWGEVTVDLGEREFILPRLHKRANLLVSEKVVGRLIFNAYVTGHVGVKASVSDSQAGFVVEKYYTAAGHNTNKCHRGTPPDEPCLKQHDVYSNVCPVFRRIIAKVLLGQFRDEVSRGFLAGLKNQLAGHERLVAQADFGLAPFIPYIILEKITPDLK